MNVTQLIRRLDVIDQETGLGLGVCSEDHRKRFPTIGLPESLTYLFTSHWPQLPGRAGIRGARILSTAQMMSAENEVLIHFQLFKFGSTGCGDSVVVDLQSKSFEIKKLNYDYEFDGEDQVRKYLTTISKSFFEFLESTEPIY